MLFNRIFRREKPGPEISKSRHFFGSFLDCNKPGERDNHYRKAGELFRDGYSVEAILEILQYLNDPDRGNVEYQSNEFSVEFRIHQGRKQINGRLDNQGLQAEASMAEYDRANASFLRNVLERNYFLQYCRFSQPQSGKLSLHCHLAVEKLSAEKVFFALKELCLKADIAGEELLFDFDELKETGLSPKYVCPEEHWKLKSRFLREWSAQTLDALASKNTEKEPLPVSLLIINFFYRADYLLRPSGKPGRLIKIGMEDFRDKTKALSHRVQKARELLKELQQLDESVMRGSFCSAVYTFGLLKPSSHKEVSQAMVEQLQKGVVFRHKKDEHIRLLMLENIAGYCLFVFGMYEPVKELLTMVYRVLYPEFFHRLGMGSRLYNTASDTLNPKEILAGITRIVETHRQAHPRLRFYSNMLVFTNLNTFLESFLQEITRLNFDEKNSHG